MLGGVTQIPGRQGQALRFSPMTTFSSKSFTSDWGRMGFVEWRMDGSFLLNALLVILFVLIGGVFAGTEMAIVSLRESQVKRIESRGGPGPTTAALVRNPNRFLSAVQIGVTLAGFFSSAYGASTLAPDIEPILIGWGIPDGIADLTALIGMTLVIASSCISSLSRISGAFLRAKSPPSVRHFAAPSQRSTPQVFFIATSRLRT